MLNGDGNENSKKISVGLISKKSKTLQPRAAHFFYTFLCRCFARLQRETSRNLCVPVHFFFSPPLIFTLVAATTSISPFSHRRYKIFMFFVQRYRSPLVFISRSNSSSVIHVNVGIEIKSKERIGFHCYCFYL